MACSDGAWHVKDPNGSHWLCFKAENTTGPWIWHLGGDPQAVPTWTPSWDEGTSTLQPRAQPMEIVERLRSLGKQNALDKL